MRLHQRFFGGVLEVFLLTVCGLTVLLCLWVSLLERNDSSWSLASSAFSVVEAQHLAVLVSVLNCLSSKANRASITDVPYFIFVISSPSFCCQWVNFMFNFIFNILLVEVLNQTNLEASPQSTSLISFFPCVYINYWHWQLIPDCLWLLE